MPRSVPGGRTVPNPEEDWLAELERIGRTDAGTSGYLTRVEIQQAKGWSEDRVSRLLHLAAARGRLETSKETRPNLDGSAHVRPVYRIKPAEKPKP